MLSLAYKDIRSFIDSTQKKFVSTRPSLALPFCRPLFPHFFFKSHSVRRFSINLSYIHIDLLFIGFWISLIKKCPISTSIHSLIKDLESPLLLLLPGLLLSMIYLKTLLDFLVFLFVFRGRKILKVRILLNSK